MTVYKTRGTCSREVDVELDGGKIVRVDIIGGCHGNLQGISKLLEGMDAREAIARMRGICCGSKPTSCPDQISYALEKALEETEG